MAELTTDDGSTPSPEAIRRFEERNATHGINVPLTKLEVAASLGAVGAVMDSCPGAPPEPLVSAFEKFQKALDELNGDTDA